MTLSLKIITASTRPGRIGPVVADWMTALAREHTGFDVEEVDLAKVALPFLDEPAHPRLKTYIHAHTKRWSATVESADAFIFVTPEYDFFPPAVLVNALQALFFEWAKKPAGVVSYGGPSGGLRATQVLRGLLGNLDMMALPQSVAIPLVHQLAKDGVLVATDPMVASAKTMLGELERWAIALKPMRSA